MPTQAEYQRELIAFDEKISLAEIEVNKAKGRVKELIYQKARFNMEYVNQVVRSQNQTPSIQQAKPNGTINNANLPPMQEG